MLKNKKGQTLDGLQGVIWTLVIIGIMLVVGLTVLDNLQDTTLDADVTGCNATTTTNCTEAYTAAGATIDAVSDISDWLPVIVVIIIAAVILGLVYFFRRTGE